jgi:hypothetical protein
MDKVRYVLAVLREVPATALTREDEYARLVRVGWVALTWESPLYLVVVRTIMRAGEVNVLIAGV